MSGHPICDFPYLYGRGECCGETPCKLELYWPCEAEGGCPDRSTCSPPWGCQDIRPKTISDVAALDSVCSQDIDDRVAKALADERVCS